MDSPPSFLLKTKLNFPSSRPGLVPRLRLTGRVEEGLKTKLLLISAPAGSGKTSLLADWRATPAGAKFPVAWLSLEETDNDPNGFWTYVASALEGLQPGAGESALSLLKGIQPVSLEIVLAELINSVENSMPDHFALVLEDYHFIKEPPIHRTISFLLDHLPSRMHLIIISRADPPFSLSRFRVRAELVEIRAQDLRFRKNEITEFLAGFNLTMTQLEDLEVRTEGWVAGLQLAAISLRECEDVDGFVRAFTGSHRLVLDYLVEEVLNNLPEDISDFLYRTSVLDRLTPSLCNAVTGKNNAEVILEKLKELGLFIIPLDQEYQWYRYHHLFAQVLRQRFKQKLPGEELNCHTRAAQWYREQKMVAAAVHHLLEGQRYEQVAELIEQSNTAWFIQGEAATLLRYLDILPASVRESHPKLAFLEVRARASRGSTMVNPDQLDKIEVDVLATLTDPAERSEFTRFMMSFRALVFSNLGRIREAIELSRKVLAETDHPYTRLGPLISLCIAYDSEADPASVISCAEEILKITGQIGSKEYTLFGYFFLVLGHIARGEFRLAWDNYNAAMGLLYPEGKTGLERGSYRHPFIEGMLLVYIGETWLEWNDLETATRYIGAGADLCRRVNRLEVAMRGYTNLLRIKLSQGDRAGLAEVWSLAKTIPWDNSLAAWKNSWKVFEASLELANGNLTQAEEFAARYFTSSRVTYAYLREREALFQARLYQTQEKLDEAQALLEDLLKNVEGSGRGRIILEINAYLALLLAKKSDQAGALLALEKALVQAEPENLIFSFLELGAPMFVLLELARQEQSLGKLSRVSPDFLKKLLEAFKQPAVTLLPADNYKEAGLSQPPGPLSDRELEILRLIETGCSDQEIAQQLTISFHTVKTHVRNIFAKLEVHNRPQALRQAHRLGLLPQE